MIQRFSTLLKLAAVAVMLLGALPSTAEPPKFFAVLNAKNPTRQVRVADVRAMFMGTTSFWNGVVPIKLVLVARTETVVGTAFFEDVLGTTGKRFTQHWTTRQLAGQGTSPDVVDDVVALCTRVKASPGAISVVSAAEAETARTQPGVKVLPIE